MLSPQVQSTLNMSQQEDLHPILTIFCTDWTVYHSNPVYHSNHYSPVLESDGVPRKAFVCYFKTTFTFFLHHRFTIPEIAVLSVKDVWKTKTEDRKPCGLKGDGQNQGLNTDPQSMESPNGLPKWTTLKWSTPKNNIPNEY